MAGEVNLRATLARPFLATTGTPQVAYLLVEAQHIASKRPSRALAGEAAQQDQNVLQTALRVSF